MNIALPGALLVILSFAACNKPEDIKSAEDTILGTWVRTSGNFTYRSHASNMDTTIDYWTPAASCIKDDALEFQSNYKGLLHLGGQACNAGDPESTSFHWEVTGGGSGIRIYDASEYFPVTLDLNGTLSVLTSKSMVIRYQKVVVNDIMHWEDTLRVTDVYKKQ